MKKKYNYECEKIAKMYSISQSCKQICSFLIVFSSSFLWIEASPCPAGHASVMLLAQLKDRPFSGKRLVDVGALMVQQK